MNIPDLTPEQDAAFVILRRLHNRDNPNDQRTKAQIIDAYAFNAFQSAVVEADQHITGEELRNSYKAASASVQAQINTLLGLA